MVHYGVEHLELASVLCRLERQDENGRRGEGERERERERSWVKQDELIEIRTMQ
jgi:hypothetical protein